MIRKITILLSFITALQGFGDGDALYRKGAAAFKNNPIHALELFEQAATAGNVSAMVGAGHCYETGTGAKIDYTQAIRFYDLAVKQNSLKACEGLARIYASCPEPAFHDGEKAVKYASVVVRKHPRDADALALFAAGYARNFEFKKAAELQTKAARHVSMDRVADFKQCIEAYQCGEPFPATATPAWMLAATDKGSPWAMFQQGTFCEKEGDYAQAVSWYEKAAQLEFLDAQLKWADCLWEGRITRLNSVEAFKLYTAISADGVALTPEQDKRMVSFAKDWDIARSENEDDCFVRGLKAEHWLEAMLERGITGEEQETLRKTVLSSALHYYAIADYKGHSEAFAAVERLTKLLDGITLYVENDQ